ncbi:hypothetical protein HYS95_01015 [Candidatus Daviesbacteria bacterium]|nr:hypothetical protein [Candidatus Daviesbacteria bacterium]
MADSERDLFVPNKFNFQSVIGYREVEKSPPVVVRQTHTLLGLYYQGVIRNSEPAQEYLHDYTLGYLKAAADGAPAYYEQIKGQSVHEVDLETREATDYAAVIMSFLPDKAKSAIYPQGFSKKGSLKPPATLEEFLERIKELRIGVWLVVVGDVEPRTTLEAYPPLLRTFKFFEVGNRLPVKLTDDERKQETLEREKFNDLLGEIDISL